MIRYSRGGSPADARPAQRVCADFSAFAAAVLADRHEGAYICAPMVDSRRCKAGCDTRRFLGFDYDGGDPDEFALLCLFFAEYSGFMYTTRSATKEKPRARFLVELSREVSREEGMRLGAAMGAMIKVPLDPSVWRGEQPMFVPPKSGESKRYAGGSVDVDALLRAEGPPEPRYAPGGADPYMALLAASGALLRPLGPGKTAIRCPYEAQHEKPAGSGDSSTAYLWPYHGGYIRGKIHCLHQHCGGRTQDDYVRALGGDPRTLWANGDARGEVLSHAEHDGEDTLCLGEDAFHGVAGEIARAIEPLTESDTAAVLVQTLVLFGALVGRGAYYSVEADKHHCNLFMLLIGGTGKSRKGTSLGQVRSIFELCTDRAREISGLSTGEGVKYQLRDAGPRPGKNSEWDEGVADKRIVVVEPEFAGILKVASRPGSTLSTTLRNAWDSGNLATLTRVDPIVVTGAHIAIIGHITARELIAGLSDIDASNGFINRFLLLCTRRSKCLPRGGGCLNEKVRQGFAQRIARAAGNAPGRMELTPPAALLWADEYPSLSEGVQGLVGEVTARAEAHVVRLATIYACLDERTAIHEEHLGAALAVWTYCADSAAAVFCDVTLGNYDPARGSDVAEKILRWLTGAPGGLTQSALHRLFANRLTASQLTEALFSLRNAGRAKCERRESATKPTILWFATVGGK